MKKLLVSFSPFDVTLAHIEEDKLCRYDRYILKNLSYLEGNVYLGKVSRIIPSMNAAFVDIGGEIGYLHYSNVVHKFSKASSISDVLHVGDIVIVQIIKESIRDKKVKLSNMISLFSRYVILNTYNNLIKFSSKLQKEEKSYISTIVECNKTSFPHGYLFRTECNKLTEQELVSEAKSLNTIWDNIVCFAKNDKTPRLLFSKSIFLNSFLASIKLDDFDSIEVEGDDCINFKEFIEDFFGKDYLKLIKIKNEDIFAINNLNNQFNLLFDNCVKLKNGGEIVIEHTEAMTVIDVNTSSFVGFKDEENTRLLINQAAAKEICNQIVLRNISGIIVIDFLDMMKDENKHKILCILSKFFNDKYEKIIGFNELGLVFIKRKRVKNSVDDILLDEELLKDDKSQMLKPIYLMSEIYKKIVYHCNYDNIDNFILYVSNHLNKFFTENDSSMLKELVLVCHKKIELKVVNSFSNNKYEVIAG